MSVASLRNTPEISFAETDSKSIESSVLSAYEKIAKTTLYPGDPVRLFLESLAYLITVQNELIDLAGKQNLLAFATGAHLDHLGYLMGVTRIPAQAARTVLRFSLATPMSFDVPVPMGTRATTMDRGVIFATDTNAIISAGRLYVDVAAHATISGSSASGLVAGQISNLIDPLPYIVSVSNTEMIGEGSDVEDDERLRERIRIAPESYTVAGSAGAYEARVLEVSAEISAVSVTTPEPGVVDVRFVMENGELPDPAIIDLVEDHLDAETVRPLTDTVLVGAPDIVEYSVSGFWYLKKEDAIFLSSIMAAVEKALEDYRLWQRGMPGRDINPSRLISVVEQAGAKRVELREPVFRHLEATEIAREKEFSLAFGGVEDE